MVNIQQIDIRTLLPQRPPILMVDRLLSADDKRAETELLVRTDNIFVENGTLKTYALIENMAQTCAAQLGFADVYVNGKKDVRIGYIGAVKRMQIENSPRVGETLRTRMEVTEDFGDMKLVTAESFVNDCRIAVAELTIALSGERREA
ncbi:MAG: pseudouridylate synthase [Bacteroidales bacterium]|nr:pseudouridylate synthase [Bacteroidales bacterium]MBR4637092.1 pseudouridylate synthase [Bacteroidales bacterium]